MNITLAPEFKRETFDLNIESFHTERN